jgi:hypothetical protein
LYIRFIGKIEKYCNYSLILMFTSATGFVTKPLYYNPTDC